MARDLGQPSMRCSVELASHRGMKVSTRSEMLIEVMGLLMVSLHIKVNGSKVWVWFRRERCGGRRANSRLIMQSQLGEGSLTSTTKYNQVQPSIFVFFHWCFSLLFECLQATPLVCLILACAPGKPSGSTSILASSETVKSTVRNMSKPQRSDRVTPVPPRDNDQLVHDVLVDQVF